MRWSSALYLLAFAVVGCTDTQRLVRVPGATATLIQAGSAYVALPADGRYGEILYASSGAQTAQSVAAAFAPYLKKITVATTIEDMDAARRSAQAGGNDYMLFAQILQWEDRATEWSGKSDRISVKLSVIRTDSGAVVNSAVVEGKSKWMTFGGDHPQDLLAVPMQQYAGELFAH